MSEKFKRVIEDFDCLHCGTHVVGNGFTNHCPKCLYSLHVDSNPGDRAMLEKCGSLMEPVDIAPKGKRYSITHRCLKCNHKQDSRTSDNDNVEALIDSIGKINSIVDRLPPIK